MVGQHLPQTNKTCYSVFRSAIVDFRGTKYSHEVLVSGPEHGDLSTRISEQRSTEITQWVLHWSSVLRTLRICCSVQWIIQGIVFWTDAPQFYARNAWPGIENHSPQKTNSVHASRDKALLQKSVLVSQFFWSLVWFKHSWFCIHWVVPLIEWKVKTPNLAWY